MTNKKLQERALYWIDKFKLGPPVWSITVSFGKEEELDGSLGLCSWNIDYATAEIKIASEKEHTNSGTTIDETIVHELGHLRFEGHKDCTSERDPHIERALNILAEIIVSYEQNTKPTGRRKNKTLKVESQN